MMIFKRFTLSLTRIFNFKILKHVLYFVKCASDPFCLFILIRVWSIKFAKHTIKTIQHSRRNVSWMKTVILRAGIRLTSHNKWADAVKLARRTSSARSHQLWFICGAFPWTWKCTKWCTNLCSIIKVIWRKCLYFDNIGLKKWGFLQKKS